ncbi:hypothetical protein [Pseudomonas quasicaspiana]|uniref:hypothetical protein n=1 Tax=Pseudomonas quasicaspiana TaxID=2829821 RepID=UPI001E2C47F5|nr:hypothetical protein [Pseudomonas quasicaspiana]MCD5971525.1 hypothetical protein [Pseudomonas quasicaspiana]
MLLIPPALFDQLRLKAGARISFDIDERMFVISPAFTTPSRWLTCWLPRISGEDRQWGLGLAVGDKLI